MRYLLVLILLLIGSNAFGSEKSISITIKPVSGIIGTVSFNMHSNQLVTVLVYESASNINETPVSIDTDAVAKISQLS